ncbi:FCD domain-containing protein [Rhizobium sp. BK068]|uniref:FadR/GntR family transcriptional regulator n=1 Tax=unclassified Rhizobium TaxID=2613769 RepID=UPI0010DF768C|nr:FCD domain-containing protein [Rhizobium sp. BK068]MBB4170188.1 DNA-binding FadR family transcriptional regulator [Rhizobium sp. BK538]TCM76319.1 GntR family transcriptional regulator [Rhizobium sp. BK068]
MDSSNRASAVDDVVRQIRVLIRERGLGVGDVLPSEVELATMFDSSRNTVREAFRTLKAYGVAESRQKVGAVLTDQHQNAMRDLFSFAMEISVDAFRDIQGYRRLTEMNLFDLLAERLTGQALAEMEAVNAAILTAQNAERASELDFQFHRLLVDAAGNRTLSETYGMLKPVIQRLMLAGKSQRPTLQAVVAEHCDILQALSDRDRIGFVYHMDRHLSAGLEFISTEKSGGG